MSSTPFSFFLTDVQSLASTRLVSIASCSPVVHGSVASLCESNGAAGMLLATLATEERVGEELDEAVAGVTFGVDVRVWLYRVHPCSSSPQTSRLFVL